MRTTLTSLDPDVAAILERVRAARDATLKDVVNEGLRRGLKQMTQGGQERTGYRTEAVSLGRCLIGDLDNVTEALRSLRTKPSGDLLDANLLVYAHVSTFVQHERARAWLDDRLSGSLPIGFPWLDVDRVPALGDQRTDLRAPRTHSAGVASGGGFGWAAR